jgi:hypothetical protein
MAEQTGCQLHVVEIFEERNERLASMSTIWDDATLCKMASAMESA